MQAEFMAAASRVDPKRPALDVWRDVLNDHPKQGEVAPAAQKIDMIRAGVSLPALMKLMGHAHNPHHAALYSTLTAGCLRRVHARRRAALGAGRGAWSGAAIGGGIGLADSLLLRKGKNVQISSGTPIQVQLDQPINIGRQGPGQFGNM